jgi:hypothetical protein
MKTKQKQQQLPFGDLVMAAYQVWGPRLAARILRAAIRERFVVFDGHPYFSGSPVKGGAV